VNMILVGEHERGRMDNGERAARTRIAWR